MLLSRDLRGLPEQQLNLSWFLFPSWDQEVFLCSLNPFLKGDEGGNSCIQVPLESHHGAQANLMAAMPIQDALTWPPGAGVTLGRVLQARSGGHGEGADPE